MRSEEFDSEDFINGNWHSAPKSDTLLVRAISGLIKLFPEIIFRSLRISVSEIVMWIVWMKILIYI